MIVFLMYKVMINEVGCEGKVTLGKVLKVTQTLQTLR